MKFFMLLAMLFSVSAFANLNDFECRTKTRSGADLFVEIERPIFRNSSYRDITISSTKGEEVHFERYPNAWVRNRAALRISFWTSGLDLEINTFLTNGQLIFGRQYPAAMRASEFNEGRQISNLVCTYYGF